MKTRFLFPHRWKIAGLVLFIIGVITHFFNDHYYFLIGDWQHAHHLIFNFQLPVILDDVEYLTVIVGLLLIGFSKETTENEQIAQLRLDSLQWAVYFNYSIFIICIIFINGDSFLTVVAYNVVSQLIFFIIRFRWKIYLLNRLINQPSAS